MPLARRECGRNFLDTAAIVAGLVAITAGCDGSRNSASPEPATNIGAANLNAKGVAERDPYTSKASSVPEILKFYSAEQNAYQSADSKSFAKAYEAAICPDFQYKDYDTITRPPADKLRAVKIELSDIMKVEKANVVVRNSKISSSQATEVIDLDFAATRKEPGSNAPKEFVIIGTSQDTWKKLGASWKLYRSVWLTHKFTYAGVRRQLGTDGAVDFSKVYK